VLLTGPLPTPGVAYLTRALRVDLGVVISASHNPFGDNGVKFFSASGEKLPDAVGDGRRSRAGRAGAVGRLGRARQGAPPRRRAGRYIEFCKSTFSQELSLKGLKIVVDGAHGAAYHVAPDVFHELGAEVVAIGCEPNGFNINDKVGATAPQALVEVVVAHGADYGVALDGDADRLQMVDARAAATTATNCSTRWWPTAWRAASRARRRRHADDQHGGRAGAANAGVPLRAREGGRPLRAGRAAGARLAARRREGSGHLLVLDKHTTGDGIVSALQVLQASAHGKTLPALLDGVSCSRR
jgi:phosphoglucosamine mutase